MSGKDIIESSIPESLITVCDDMSDWAGMKSAGTIQLSLEGSINFMEAVGYPTGFESIDEEVGNQEGLDDYIKECRNTLLAQ